MRSAHGWPVALLASLVLGLLGFSDHSHPPVWNIKTFTQRFINGASVNNGKIFKIHRKLNTTAHILATQAFRSLSSDSTQMQIICNNAAHVNSCPTKTALQSVIGDLYTNIAVRCS